MKRPLGGRKCLLGVRKWTPPESLGSSALHTSPGRLQQVADGSNLPACWIADAVGPPDEPTEKNLPPGLTIRRRHRIFALYVLVMVLAFLVPVPTVPLAESKHLDKLVHFGVFLGFAILFHLDRPLNVGWTFLISCAFAGAIEMVQWFLPYRDADWWDFIAGAAGAGVGVLLLMVTERKS
jgi:VanZ family protein